MRLLEPTALININLNEDGPILSATKCRPMILVSGNIGLRCNGACRYSRVFLLARASNESGVVDNGNFADLSGYFFGNFRDKASNIIWDMLPLVGL